MVSDNKPQPNYLPWIIVAVLGYMLWKDKTPAPVPPGPVVPVVSAESEARNLIKGVADGYKAVFSDAAAKVKDKSLTNEEQLFSTLKEGLKNVREKSSAGFDKLITDTIPTEFDDGNRGAVVTFLESAAKGFGVR